MATNAVVEISGPFATYYCAGVDSEFIAIPKRIRHVIYQGIRIANVTKPMSNVDVVVHALKHVHDNLYKYRTTTHIDEWSNKREILETDDAPAETGTCRPTNKHHVLSYS